MARRHRTRRRQGRRQARRTARQRKQRGGDDSITNIDTWVEKVKEQRVRLVKQPDSPERPFYTFGDLANKNLILPAQKIVTLANSDVLVSESDDPSFLLHEFPYDPKDIRAIGKVLEIAMFLEFAQWVGKTLDECTVTDFKRFIEFCSSDTQVETYGVGLIYLSAVEAALRGVAGETSGNAFSVTTNGEQAYPLYTWYLVMNLPKEDGGAAAQVEAVPVLIEEKEEAVLAPTEPPATGASV